jgi:REP element-mobilizing transposase RayT
MLRHANIDYSHGTFFVTIQAAFNKTIFGAVVGTKSELNVLGEAVAESLRTLGERYPGTEVIEFVVMPNHIHVLLRIARREDNRKHQLGYVIGRFKGWIAKVYRDLRAAGRAANVGATPWQQDYWEKLVTSEEKLQAYRRYIRQNPAKWTSDRFGAVTSYAHGNIVLLNKRLVGFVASQGVCVSELRPRLVWRRKAGAEARLAAAGAEARHPEVKGEARHPEVRGEARYPEVKGEARHPEQKGHLEVVISTFTSAQERAVLGKLLARGRRFVRIYPGGIPAKEELAPAVARACEVGNGLLISPVPSGTGLNKQRAVWCNEYGLKHACGGWAGAITPGGTLASLVKGLGPWGAGLEARPGAAGTEARHPEMGVEARHPEMGVEARHPEMGVEARHPNCDFHADAGFMTASVSSKS